MQTQLPLLSLFFSLSLALLLLNPTPVLSKKTYKETSSSSSSEVAQVTAPPPFFLQAADDGLCLSGGTFKRCSIDTLWFVVGKPGEYQIHKRGLEEDSKELCLSRQDCTIETDINKSSELKLTKCSYCGAKNWNILGDADQGYALSFDEGTSCLVREIGGIKALTVNCDTTVFPYTPLHLNFANKEDIKAMNSEGARFITAAGDGDKSAVKRYLKEGVDVNVRDWDNMSPLISAASAGHLDIVKLLTKNKADVNAVDKDQITPLMEATIMGHYKVVTHLVDKSADVNAKATSGVNALWLASGEGRDDILKYLIKKGGDVKVTRVDGISALHTASVGGHVKVVKMLISGGMDVNLADNEGLTPLMNACENGTVAVLKELMSAGADINALSNNGFSAIIVAAAGGFLDAVKFLIDNGADANSSMKKDGVTALMYAASGGHIAVVELLVSKGAEIDTRHSNGGTALMEGASTNSTNNVQVIKYLIGKGASHNIFDNDKVSPLMSASSQGAFEIVELILNAERASGSGSGGDVKALVNAAANSGGTAIMFASGSGSVKCVEYLIAAGADVNAVVEATPEYLDQMAKDIESGTEVEPHTDGITSLHIAATGGHLEVVKLLIENKADVKAKDDDEKSALTAAVKGTFPEVASLLITKGADANEPYIDEEGVSHNLLMDAIIVDNFNFTKLIIESGADLNLKDSHGVTTLIQSAHKGMTEVVELLLKYGGGSGNRIDVNAANDEGITAVIAASSEGHADIVKLLVNMRKEDIDLNSKDKDGTNALMAAAVRGHKEIVAVLIENNAMVNEQNVDGHTALMFGYNGKNQVDTLWARYQSFVVESEEEKKLEQIESGSGSGSGGEGELKNEEDEEENSKVIKDAVENHTSVVTMLIKAGADESIKDNEGHIAADFDFHPEVSEEDVEREKSSVQKRVKSKNEL